jgi:transmembrane sensor
MDQEKYIELYEKYLAGECSDTEKELLLKYLDGFELKEYSWEEAMGDREHIKEIIYSKLQSSTKQRATRRFNWARWSVAASLLIAVCFAGYKYRLFLTSKIPVKQKIAARINNDATPGSNKAILTLADGSKIVLDNTKKGLITNHDGVAVNQHNQGQLVYDMRKSNAVAEQASVINTISTPVGGQYQVILADGTKVWLNAASSLRFPTMFSGSERNVEVSG